MNFSDAKKSEPISVDDYLEGEKSALRKYEYVAGMVYAMSGARYAHNLIASRILGELHSQLKDSPCVPLGSDNKICISEDTNTWFYYPDVSVVCGDNIMDAVYQDKPNVIVEVLSMSTRRIDLGEKKDVYQKLDSLITYILFEQEQAEAIIFRRTNKGFERTVVDQAEATIQLPEIGATLSLSKAYAGVPFTKETVEEHEIPNPT